MSVTPAATAASTDAAGTDLAMAIRETRSAPPASAMRRRTASTRAETSTGSTALPQEGRDVEVVVGIEIDVVVEPIVETEARRGGDERLTRCVPAVEAG